MVWRRSAAKRHLARSVSPLQRSSMLGRRTTVLRISGLSRMFGGIALKDRFKFESVLRSASHQ